MVAYFLLGPGQITPEVLLAAMSGVLGSAFFFHRSHAEDAHFTKELLLHFNTRYDELNDELQKIKDLPEGTELDQDLKMKILDYFNLCSEEWLFRRAGYIWDPVWDSWENGMRQYSNNKIVKQLWTEEAKTNSYYGFIFPGIAVPDGPN